MRPLQVKDDPALLELMLSDNKVSTALYQPTHYWSIYENELLPELRQKGLHDFRSRKKSRLKSFGATDLSPQSAIDMSRFRLLNNGITIRFKGWQNFLSLQNRVMNNLFPTTNMYDIQCKDFQRLCYEFAKVQGERVGAKPLNQFCMSLVGNPEDVFEIESQKYSMHALNCYLRYAYCHRHVNFDSLNTIVELGCGSGKQVEVIKKLHPNIGFILFDIPAQLYVCEQYLKSVFQDQVVSYRETREWKEIHEDLRGKICILGAHQFSMIEKIKYDLFWNSASFQEMEPDVVQNYLRSVNISAKMTYLYEEMRGKKKANKRGEYGVLEQTTLEHYKVSLFNFDLVDLSPAFVIPRMSRCILYSDSFWKKHA